MKNADLLLMGGGKSYPDATHWLTVGDPGEAGGGYVGFANPWNINNSGNLYYGALEPAEIGGQVIRVLTEVFDSESGAGVGIFGIGSNGFGRIGNGVRITNLINGNYVEPVATKNDSAYSYFNANNAMMLEMRNFVGQRIPLKIEVV